MASKLYRVETQLALCITAFFIFGCSTGEIRHSKKNVKTIDPPANQESILIVDRLDESIIDLFIYKYGARHELERADNLNDLFIAELGPVHEIKKRNNLTHYLWYSNSRVVRLATSEDSYDDNIIVFPKTALQHGRPVISRSSQIHVNENDE